VVQVGRVDGWSIAGTDEDLGDERCDGKGRRVIQGKGFKALEWK